MPTPTYEPIATYTVGSSQSDITFNSFGGYTDLILVANIVRVSGSDTRVQVNGDTGTNYSYTFLGGNGSSASSFRVTNATQWDLGYSANTSPTTLICNFQNYANTTTYKTVVSRFSSTGGDVSAFASLWRNTSAITSIKIYQNGSNLGTGSSVTLYGIKAA
jgi:hypothetical protein